MTRRDLPYVLLIAVFMVVMFFAGRYSVARNVQAPIQIASARSIAASTIGRDAANDRVTVAEPPPRVVAVEVLPEKRLPKPVSKPAEAHIAAPVVVASAPVPPMKIELEDDPAAVANPYKVKSAPFSPGF